MGFDFNAFVNKKAAVPREGEFIKPAKKGTAIVKDAYIYDGFGDPQTFKLILQVKSAQPFPGAGDPDAPGDTVVYMEQLTAGKYPESAQERAMAAILAVLGDVDVAAKGDEIKKLLRTKPDGLSDRNVPCPARGVEISYETTKKVTDSGKTIYPPVFYSVPFNAESVKANLAALDG